MLARLTSSAISENINSQPFLPLQVRREYAWTSGAKCVPAEWWGHLSKGPREPGDSRTVTPQILNGQQKYNLLVLVFSGKPLGVRCAALLLLFLFLPSRQWHQVVGWLSILNIRHEGIGRTGRLGWCVVGSLGNWSAVCSPTYENSGWEQRCLPMYSASAQCASKNNLCFKEAALSFGSSKNKKRNSKSSLGF